MLDIFKRFTIAIASKFTYDLLKLLPLKALIALICAMYLSSLESMNHFVTAHLAWLLGSLIFLFLYSAYLTIQLVSSKLKIVVNGIAVDKKGNCFCSECFKKLDLIKSETSLSKVFYCKPCDKKHYPWMDNGDCLQPPTFISFQIKNPQTVVTYAMYRAHLGIKT